MANGMKLSRRSFIVMSLALAACKRGDALLELTGNTMGTSYSVVALDATHSVDKAAMQQAIDISLAQTHAQMSNWDASSEVSRFNATRSTAPMQISAELAEVVKAAQKVSSLSDGQFDITLGPVIEAWGFGADKAIPSHAPATAVLEQAIAAAGETANLNVDGTEIRKSNPDTRIYLSSIGKGFGVDQVARSLKGLGLENFMVEIGGDLYVSGMNPDGDSWKIGIESPDALSAQALQVAQISNLGMATSGDYRNYFEEDGQRFSHIIDARTGRPITHTTASVTVLAENAMLADAWATALLVVGRERGMEIANEQNLAAMFIERNTSEGHMKFNTASSRRFTELQA